VPPAFTFRTVDVDQARAAVAQHFYANTLDVLDRSTPLQAAFDIIELGPLTLGDMRWGADVRMRFGELGAYHVDLPLSGQLVWRQGRTGRPVTADVNQAAVFQPVGDTVLDACSADCRLIAVKIDRAVLHTRLEQMLDAPLRGPVRLAPLLDVATGAGRTWASLTKLLAAEVHNPNGLAHHPLLGPRLIDAVVEGLLLAATHRYRDALEHPGTRYPPPQAIRRAVDAIQANPQHPYTLASLAEVAGLSQRALVDGFHRLFAMAR
jgi:hypothetical protein